MTKAYAGVRTQVLVCFRFMHFMDVNFFFFFLNWGIDDLQL